MFTSLSLSLSLRHTYTRTHTHSRTRTVFACLFLQLDFLPILSRTHTRAPAHHTPVYAITFLSHSHTHINSHIHTHLLFSLSLSLLRFLFSLFTSRTVHSSVHPSTSLSLSLHLSKLVSWSACSNCSHTRWYWCNHHSDNEWIFEIVDPIQASTAAHICHFQAWLEIILCFSWHELCSLTKSRKYNTKLCISQPFFHPISFLPHHACLDGESSFSDPGR